MSLFNFFNRSRRNGQIPTSAVEGAIPVISESTFIEKEPDSKQENQASPLNEGIQLLYEFLDKNYEIKGYDDALVNPDNTHLEQNVIALKNDLERSIRKVKTFYEDFIREINFHIASRSRSGMIDIVEELTVKKETAESHISQVIEIEEQSRRNEGVGHGIIISYTRGFRNGLAAISSHLILNKNY
ncbi:hypothetical protein SAMN05444266_102187 [Chitinophaga jiangningensis]|uniref:Uncharacterized protein n=1 Tax=Chitinophaga jiangningensis TaxID=1419482 RepID=A0A1M6Y7V2_9BACT|nr:hypothetical protein [Chitinophaga jiangningensis]SHL14212.1 hypothetical protein SAMN05444266_102187 [Chitinophaga jiangningensis]